MSTTKSADKVTAGSFWVILLLQMAENISIIVLQLSCITTYIIIIYTLVCVGVINNVDVSLKGLGYLFILQ